MGVHVTGGANLIEGVHTWNDATHALSPGYGIVASDAESTRILAVYLGVLHACVVTPMFVTDTFTQLVRG